MRSTFRGKPNRLPADSYRGRALYSLTLARFNRRPAFINGELVRQCVETLRQTGERHGARIHAYCFMPDHLHLLIEGGEDMVLPDFVKDFKQRTGYQYQREKSRPLWQKSYYDHIPRSEEAIIDVVRYIMANPVCAGLITEAGAYAHSGSFVWDRGALLEA